MAQRGGCLLKGFLAVMVSALVLVVGVIVSVTVSLRTGEGRADDRMRDQVREHARHTRDELARGAADGRLLDTEIDRAAGGQWKRSAADVRGRGRHITLTVSFREAGGGWFGGQASGCYRYEVDSRAVSFDSIPEETCRALPPPRRRAPEAVAADVVVELRAALKRGGPDGARSAPVWTTPGIDVEDSEVTEGGLTVLAWLDDAGPGVRVCYGFRARTSTRTVTAERLKPGGCHRLQREREARAEASGAPHWRRAHGRSSTGSTTGPRTGGSPTPRCAGPWPCRGRTRWVPRRPATRSPSPPVRSGRRAGSPSWPG
ncbi:hypothetical protein ACFY93_07125 [Streptomyces sp. NPDC008313]|uniref:hypothetical protein n=1 Tax=Streptomyces sp. NPDC008313 TaxID=3364826 RepID=UPI0036E1D0BB